MIDVELFIVEIEKHECLWNVTSILLMNKDFKRTAWNDISMVMFKDWESSDLQEREALSKFIISRFHSYSL